MPWRDVDPKKQLGLNLVNDSESGDLIVAKCHHGAQLKGMKNFVLVKLDDILLHEHGVSMRCEKFLELYSEHVKKGKRCRIEFKRPRYLAKLRGKKAAAAAKPSSAKTSRKKSPRGRLPGRPKRKQEPPKKSPGRPPKSTERQRESAAAGGKPRPRPGKKTGASKNRGSRGKSAGSSPRVYEINPRDGKGLGMSIVTDEKTGEILVVTCAKDCKCPGSKGLCITHFGRRRLHGSVKLFQQYLQQHKTGNFTLRMIRQEDCPGLLHRTRSESHDFFPCSRPVAGSSIDKVERQGHASPALGKRKRANSDRDSAIEELQREQRKMWAEIRKLRAKVNGLSARRPKKGGDI